MSRRIVGEVMQGWGPTLAPWQSLAEAAAIVDRLAPRDIPVTDEGFLLGVLTATDLEAVRPSPATTLTVGEVAFALATIEVRSVMRQDAPVVAPETPLAEAARLLRDGDYQTLPVTRDGMMVGTLGTADLLRELLAISERAAVPARP